MKDYKLVIKMNNTYVPTEYQETNSKLPPGIYEPYYNKNSGQWFFEQSNFEHDEILNIPDPVYQSVVNEIATFLTPETKEKFKKYKFLYKRSTLLYGLPGTGKSTIVYRLSKDVVDNGGVVLFNPDPNITSNAIDIIRSLDKNIQVMVIFEELDQEIQDYGDSPFLNLLDGEDQHDNILYIATTNHIDRIPKRIQRPGRFSTVMEVNFPNKECRAFYLKNKIIDITPEELTEWINLSEGLSIDELSETVKAKLCLGQDLNNVINRIKKLKNLPENTDNNAVIASSIFDQLEETSRKLLGNNGNKIKKYVNDLGD